MEIKVETDRKNELVGRREIEFFVLEDDRTPNKDSLKTELCKKLSLSPDATIITRIDQSFGARQARGWAHSYKDAASLKKFEPSYIEERKEKKAKKAAAKAGGEAAPAPKKEEKKEEKKE